MSLEDIRWVQRFNNFSKAFAQLQAAVELSKERPLSQLEQQGLIQAFEYTHELAWKTLKDFLESRGEQDLYGSKDSSRAAFRAGLIANGAVWMEMIESRNLTSHTYNEETAAAIAAAVIDKYAAELVLFRQKLESLRREELRQQEEDQA
jgi:nucleotidyltransferase substrate binding protein (TIGR01987 family)